MISFNSGDVVSLKSGGPFMTVITVGGGTVAVAYFNPVTGKIEDLQICDQAVKHAAGTKPSDVYPTGGAPFNSSLNR